MTKVAPRQLLVEGPDDLHAIAALMKKHGVDWPANKDLPPVLIKPMGGVTKIMKAPVLVAELQQPGIQVLGIMLDADDEPVRRWSWFRDLLNSRGFRALPDAMPAGGLIAEDDDGLRVGLWLMSDCASTGMLETFLALLVPGPDASLWNHAGASFDIAVSLGAPCGPAHHEKARIHTWLAWQDPPGASFGLALTKRVLDPDAPGAAAFVAWFRELYRL